MANLFPRVNASTFIDTLPPRSIRGKPDDKIHFDSEAALEKTNKDFHRRRGGRIFHTVPNCDQIAR